MSIYGCWGGRTDVLSGRHRIYLVCGDLPTLDGSPERRHDQLVGDGTDELYPSPLWSAPDLISRDLYALLWDCMNYMVGGSPSGWCRSSEGVRAEL